MLIGNFDRKSEDSNWKVRVPEPDSLLWGTVMATSIPQRAKLNLEPTVSFMGFEDVAID